MSLPHNGSCNYFEKKPTSLLLYIPAISRAISRFLSLFLVAFNLTTRLPFFGNILCYKYISVLPIASIAL